jgi:hypothetical protein
MVYAFLAVSSTSSSGFGRNLSYRNNGKIVADCELRQSIPKILMQGQSQIISLEFVGR